MKVFNLPDLGEGLPDAEIVRWLVAEGDQVKTDQPMVEMETAKAVVEVPSPVTGTITKLHGKAGDVIEVGKVLVEFDGEPGAAAASDKPKAQSKPADKPAAASGGANEVFKLPDLGEGLPDAEIVRWLVAEGDAVTVDQPMVEMETAKAVVEVPCPVKGTVSKLHGQAGDVINVGAPLVEFGTGSGPVEQADAAVEEPVAASADAGTVVGAVEVGNTVVAESANAVVKALARKLKVDLAQVTGTGSDGKITQADVRKAKADGVTSSSAVKAAPASISNSSSLDENPLNFKASPAVRAMARRMGVSLADCQASGRKGSITRDDVEAAAKGSTTRPASSSSAAGLPNVTVSVEPQTVRGVRRAMAMGMAHAHATVVPTTLVDDADISGWRKGQDSLARYVRALVSAAKQVPALNCWFDGEKMERLVHPSVHIGIAVDSPDGLYVPVVKDADRLSAVEVRARVQELREKISGKALKQDDQTGATISLSNFGSIAGRYGTPIVSPPQVAILGTGRFRNELKLSDKGIASHRMLPLSLTFDHRACTGGEAARFLAAVIEDLQKPD